jgi:4-diphosphocytidyl-2-C-methyl-D-erythritol kinase
MEVKAYAKINLSLDVTGKMEDGYHSIESVMQSISLYDVVTLSDRGAQEIVVSCDNPAIPPGPDNLAYKAAYVLSKELGLKRGVGISLKKNIPVASGLAGGSTDAAAVLRGLNRLWDLNLKAEELTTIGALVGADVPFCIRGGTMLATGIGDRLKPISSPATIRYVLISPGLQVSTKETYHKFDGLHHIFRRPDTPSLVKALEAGDVENVARNLCNVLEEVTLSEHKGLRDTKEEILKAGALGALMSGSGSSLFGIAKDEEDARRICARLRDKGLGAYVASSVQGIEQIA